MLDHIGLRVTDIAKARAFYDKALAPLGVAMIMEVPAEQTGNTPVYGYGEGRKPYFWVSQVQDGKTTSGLHVAIATDSRAKVDAFYKAAVAAGAKDNGPPGLREHYHPTYYGAFVLDADGHNVEAVCHAPV